ncbi:DUF2470 domain-containing protein [Rhodoplanes sp. TEM]|uniref:DUF2470 domain-containing protein n=1 Tax=Rhodoplanes tepidamans TaxID=200616 RepID=A0ABT5J5V2_RHOTP|nr:MULTISPECIES: DUF2470 domain-containing protein [Rhodoplanes]MDC7784893.1 DUF2470 domain-containing protein [Rhodoplanes tepidamans]MDC7984011.1 DUF2470 domain-containing protein [Rhodoplanes sp. TEM]MDQ0353878.1 putative heme iron utilization protein [Rhodoplanes tepidamans]
MTDLKPPRPGTMPGRIPENAKLPEDFDPPVVARQLLRAGRSGTLATNDRNTGHPFGSLVNVATAPDGSPVLLTSRLATHTANLERDGRASILIATVGKGDPLAHPRLTVLGDMVRDDDPVLRRRFLARHPKAELYAGLPDFAIWRMIVAAFHLNGGFARAADLAPEAVLTGVAGAEELLAAEESAVAHMNQDHAEAVKLYATVLAGGPEAAWRVTGVDPDGLDLAAGDLTRRVPFPERVTTAAGLRTVLKRMADEARAKA